MDNTDHLTPAPIGTVAGRIVVYAGLLAFSIACWTALALVVSRLASC